jgi:hypothetical protein
MLLVCRQFSIVRVVHGMAHAGHISEETALAWSNEATPARMPNYHQEFDCESNWRAPSMRCRTFLLLFFLSHDFVSCDLTSCKQACS